MMRVRLKPGLGRKEIRENIRFFEAACNNIAPNLLRVKVQNVEILGSPDTLPNTDKIEVEVSFDFVIAIKKNPWVQDAQISDRTRQEITKIGRDVFGRKRFNGFSWHPEGDKGAL